MAQQTKLKQELEVLRHDLQIIDAREDDTPEEIKLMLARVNQALANIDNETPSGEEDGLLEHMQEALMKFELEHPQLMRPINVIIDSLSNAGL
ncbi:hypothetical protein MASR2M15_23530 [Anaerolineales bacterium]